MEIIKKINPVLDLKADKKEMEQIPVLSSNNTTGNNHPVEKEDPDEVIMPRKDDNDTEEIPDEIVVPENDDNNLNEIPDEVVIPRKDISIETL